MTIQNQIPTALAGGFLANQEFLPEDLETLRRLKGTDDYMAARIRGYTDAEAVELFPDVLLPIPRKITPFTATNWSEPEDDFSVMFYDQYVSQFWLPEEIPLQNDALSWENLRPEEQLVYIRSSAGLNALDTLQGEVGMYELKKYVDGHIRKATIQFQAMMEDIHAKSYSWMNKTFLSLTQERDTFEWIKNQKNLQYKIAFIKDIFLEKDTTPYGIWRKMVISCMLETALFYSGFFYPLYLAGQGKMVNSGEIFNLIK